MRGDEIRRARASRRVHHAELEEHVAGRIGLAEHSAFDVGDFVTSHFALPIIVRLISPEAARPSPSERPLLECRDDGADF